MIGRLLIKLEPITASSKGIGKVNKFSTGLIQRPLDSGTYIL